VVNLFDDPDGTYVVIVNREAHHSLWPAIVDVPAGWYVAHGEASRQECLEFIDRNWTDMSWPGPTARGQYGSQPADQ
jgi:uncharacterized protein YbdZ (MbtH family)